MRKFRDISKAFGVKLWWIFRLQSSIWAKYLNAKYIGANHPIEVRLSRGSAVWRRLLRARTMAEDHIRWIIGEGHIDVWKDKWLDIVGYNYDEKLHIKYLFSECRPNEIIVRQLLGEDAWEEMVKKNIVLTSGKDIMVWAPSNSDNFTLRSAWDLVRGRSDAFCFGKYCWHKYYPSKISIFLWILLHRALPIDTANRRKGIFVVSKCLCCVQNHHTETASHLLISSGVVGQVWGRIFGLMNDVHQNYTLTQLLQVWWQKSHYCYLEGLAKHYYSRYNLLEYMEGKE